MKKLLLAVLTLAGMHFANAQAPKNYKLTMVAEGNFGTPNGDVFTIIKASGSLSTEGPLYQSANGLSAGIDVLQDFDYWGNVAILCGKGGHPTKLAVVHYPSFDTIFTVNSGLGAGIQRCGLANENKAFLFPATGSMIKAVDIVSQEITDVLDPGGHLASSIHSMVGTGDYMYIANASKIIKIDAATNTTVGSILPGLTQINTLVRDIANNCLWVLGKSEGVSAVVKIDLEDDDAVSAPIVFTGITNAKLLRVGPNRLYFVSGTAFYLYDLISETIPTTPVYTSTITGSTWSLMYDRSFTVDPVSGDFAYSTAGAYVAPGLYEIVDGTSFTRIDSGAVAGAAIPNELFLNTWPADLWTLPVLTDIVADCEVSLDTPVAHYDEVAVEGTTENYVIATQGVHEITWRFVYETDTAYLTQQITIADTLAPVADIASLIDLLVTCPYTLESPTALDNCKGVIYGITDSITYTVAGTYEVIWTYSDDAGNTTTQVQHLVVDCDPAGVSTHYAPVAMIAPNPAQGYVQVSMATTDDYFVKITDQMGREVAADSFRGISKYFDLSRLNAGLYILQITNAKGASTTQKMVIQ